jgi:hypothetical protein
LDVIVTDMVKIAQISKPDLIRYAKYGICDELRLWKHMKSNSKSLTLISSVTRTFGKAILPILEGKQN